MRLLRESTTDDRQPSTPCRASYKQGRREPPPNRDRDRFKSPPWKGGTPNNSFNALYSPTPYSQRSSSPSKSSSFQSGAGSNVASACALCLGRHSHDVRNCRSETLWDGSTARCKKKTVDDSSIPPAPYFTAAYFHQSRTTTQMFRMRKGRSWSSKVTESSMRSLPIIQRAILTFTGLLDRYPHLPVRI